jgi:hypothetical protein
MVVARGPYRIDSWWNRSTAGFQEASLGRVELKESSKDEALEKAPVLRPISIVDVLGAGSRVCDKLAALPLDPASSAQGQ